MGAEGASRRDGAGSVASPRVASSTAVPTASRTFSRSERFFGRLVVIGGNMCSETYDRSRTETRSQRVGS